MLIGKTPAAAAKWIASFVRALELEGGRSTGSTPGSRRTTASDHGVDDHEGSGDTGALVEGRRRARPRSSSASGTTVTTAVQVGQIFVRVGGNLGAIFYNGAMPGLPDGDTRAGRRSCEADEGRGRVTRPAFAT